MFTVLSKAYKADELDSLGFMMITLSEGVQNQSNPNPNALLSSPQAVSKVGIDCPSRSCLSFFFQLKEGVCKTTFQNWIDDNAITGRGGGTL